MALINKDNLGKAHVSVESETKDPALYFEDSSLTWWSYASLGPQDYLCSADSDNKPYKKYEYSTPAWYNERKGGKKRKNRRF